MNELVQIVQQKSGLSEEQSVDIVRAVVEFVKTKLPAGLASHVDGLVGDLGGAAPAGTAAAPAETASTEAGGMLSSVIGNIFGKKEA
jgi:hypothetical protein